MDDARAFFKEADADGNGVLDGPELMSILKKMESRYPQIRALTSGGGDGMLARLLEKFDDDKNGTLDIKEFVKVGGGCTG